MNFQPFNNYMSRIKPVIWKITDIVFNCLFQNTSDEILSSFLFHTPFGLYLQGKKSICGT